MRPRRPVLRYLTTDSESIDNVIGTNQADAARSLNITEGAAKGAVHRLRKKFREHVEKEIRQILASPDDYEIELKHLLESVTQ